MRPSDTSPWTTPASVEGFASASPNAVLMRLATVEAERVPNGRALDIGCGAGRNALPLAQMGWEVFGVDSSGPMLTASSDRASDASTAARLHLMRATMDRLPIRDDSCDLLIAHGIWNLARSTDEFRRAVREAARVARSGASLFVFTFSRSTLAPEVAPVPNEEFVYTQFSGQPQCFLTASQLVAELGDAGFQSHAGVTLTEYNRPGRPALPMSGASGPAILEAAFRFVG